MTEIDFSASSRIVQFWKTLGHDLTIPEMIAYSDNGPVRALMLEMLSKTKDLPHEAAEIGALYSPLSRHIPGLSRVLLVDPIYSEKGLPILSSGVTAIPTPLPEALPDICSWRGENSILILENTLNYLDRSTTEDAFNLGFSHLIIGNNSGASFGDKHPNRLIGPKDIKRSITSTGYKTLVEEFISKDVLIGIYRR